MRESRTEGGDKLEQVIHYGTEILERDQKSRKIIRWFVEECKEILKERKEAKLRTLINPGDENRHNYKKICRSREQKYMKE